uniref:RRM domain-containing protein n=1 Tax=Lactuca sativa TaxID=4236 RepID=A0A9R1X4J0_LACSA|nr:hypothetical protein LSAT_V11C600310970 [Lactuca sativa]
MHGMTLITFLVHTLFPILYEGAQLYSKSHGSYFYLEHQDLRDTLVVLSGIKLFVGGIAWETSKESFNSYFIHYGELTNSVIMMDKIYGRPHGLRFVTFANPADSDKVLEQDHVIDGRPGYKMGGSDGLGNDSKWVKVKRTVPREDMQGSRGVSRTKKIFVGGIPLTLTKVELNFEGVFLRDPFSYNHGIKFTFKDHDFSGMTYSECITFLEWFMQESINKLYYCEPDKPLLSGITAIRNDGDYVSFIFYAFGVDEEEEEDDDDDVDPCIDGGENEDEIDNLMDVEVDFNEDILTMNIIQGDDFMNKLCVEEEEGNDNNIDDDGGEEEENITQQHSIFHESTP